MFTAQESRIAAMAYEAMEHAPNHAFVTLSYKVFEREITRQWHELREGGIRFIASEEDPYEGSAPLMDDVMNRLQVKVWTNGGVHLPDDHPMKRPVDSGVAGYTVLNDIFRGVHDVLGHAASGGQFGHKGEQAAWRMHASTLSPVSYLALWCETIGQNAWTNFAGDNNTLPLRDRPFPEQKSGLVPLALLK